MTITIALAGASITLVLISVVGHLSNITGELRGLRVLAAEREERDRKLNALIEDRDR